MGHKSVYEVIKKQNGEHFAQMLRKFDSSIFEIEGLPHILKYAGRDAEPLLDFLCMLKNVTICEVENPQNPFTLLKQAGYRAFLVDTHQKQMSIQKYFARGEGLCTFDEGDRYQRYFIIYCIKEGAEQLRRSDFTHPKREDEYGSSVISIQILKRGGFIKITNRYNHTVEFADNTFHSNPDNIIMGLSCALKHHFKVDFSASQAPLPEGYIYLNGQIIEYDYARDNVYFSSNYFVEDGKINILNKDYQLMVDRFVVDLKEKKVLNPLKICDSFAKVMTNELKQANRLHLFKEGRNAWALFGGGNCLMRVKNNLLKNLYLPTTRMIPPCFLSYDTNVEVVHAPYVQELGRNSFSRAERLKCFIFENLSEMKEGCIGSSVLDTVFMPQIKKIGDMCFHPYTAMRQLGFFDVLSLPLLEEMGYCCFSGYQIDELYLPSCKKIGNAFGNPYYPVKRAYFPELENVPENSRFEKIKDIFAPKVSLVKKSSFFSSFLGYQKIKTNE